MWSISLISPADFSTLEVIERECFELAWSETTLHFYLNNPANLCIGVYQQNELQGFAIFSCFESEAELLQIAVSVTYRGQGAASQLLENGHRMLLQRQVNEVLLEVNATNLAAIQLYEKFSYYQDGCRKNYYVTPSGREDAVLMRTKLVEAEY